MFKITGRNILDDGFNAGNVLDTENSMRFSKAGAEKLGESIRSGMQRTSTTDRNQSKISNAAGMVAKNIGQNTEEIQKLMENQGDKTREELSKLVKLMTNSQKLQGDRSVKAIKEIVKQTEKIKLVAGEDGEKLTSALGVNDAKKELTSGGGLIKSFFGVDQDAGGMESVKQAFEPSRLFGDSGFFGIGARSNTQKNAEREARLEIENDAQSSSIAEVTEDLGIAQNKKDSAQIAQQSNKTPPGSGPTAPGSGRGVDRKSEDEKQNDFLEDILKELKILNEKNFGGGGGIIPGAMKTAGGVVTSALTAGAGALATAKTFGNRLLGRDIPEADTPDKNSTKKPEADTPDKNSTKKPGSTRKPSTTSRLLKGAGRFARGAARFAGPLGLALTAGSAAYAGVQGFNADPDASTGQKFLNAGRGIGSMLSFGLIDSPEEKMEKERILQERMQMENQLQLENTRGGEESIMDGYVPNPTSLPDVSTRTLPTGDAIDNMSQASENQTINAPTINNITNNNMSGGGQTNPLIAMKDTIRDNTSIIQQRFNKSYA